MRSPTRTDAYCCERCFGASGIGLRNRMIACPRCGNKRCPKAIDHDYQCTGSNEPGQVGVKAMSNMDAHGILNAAAATIDDRAAERDVEQERSMARAVDAFNSLTGHELSETEGWLFMVILKAARANAGEYQPDDWIDMAGYVGLAGESAAKEQQRLLVRAATPHGGLGFVGQEPSEQIMRESYGGSE